MRENLEFYPTDFSFPSTLSPEEQMARMEARFIQSLFQGIAYNRRAAAAQIAAEKASMIVGDRLPSPSVAPDIAQLDNASKPATVEQYRAVAGSILNILNQVQQWQLTAPSCNSDGGQL
jgi:hypothetical protein